MGKHKPPVPQETTQLAKLGRSFKIRRNDLELNLQEVGLKADVAYWTISKLERGKLHNSSLSTLNAIAASLGLKISIICEPINKNDEHPTNED